MQAMFAKKVDPVLVSPTRIIMGGLGEIGIPIESFRDRYSLSNRYISANWFMLIDSKLSSDGFHDSPGFDISLIFHRKSLT